MPKQLTLPEMNIELSPEIICAVLQQYAPDKLMAAWERNSLLRHVQFGGKPEHWTYMHMYKDTWQVQVPELFAALAAKEAALEAIAALTEEDEDAETN